MSKKIGIDTPLGGFTYEWEKDLKNYSAEIKNAKAILKSFIIAINSGEDVKSEEIIAFLQTLRNYGHLAKLEEKDLQDYKTLNLKLNEINKKQLERFKDLLGVWNSRLKAADENLNLSLRIGELNGTISAEMHAQSQDGFPSQFAMYYHLSQTDEYYTFWGYKKVSIPPRNDETDCNTLILKFGQDKTTLLGKYTSAYNANNIIFTRVVP